MADISGELKIDHLSEIDIGRIGLIDNMVSDKIIRRRAHHVISENDRVLRAVEMLKRDDLIGFGQLMNESHNSLKASGREGGTLVANTFTPLTTSA